MFQVIYCLSTGILKALHSAVRHLCAAQVSVTKLLLNVLYYTVAFAACSITIYL